MKKFNVNETVLVKLTELGLNHWRNEFNKISIPDYTFEQHYNSYTNKEGYTSFQLHVLMELFGEVIGNGLPLMFETNILIDENKLENIC